MARITISLPENLAAAAAQRAIAEKRSASSYVALLIEQDARASGLLPADTAAAQAELIAEIQAAILQQPDILPEIKKLIRAKRRTRRAAA